MDEAGRVVQVRDRFHVELIDGRIRAIVEVEFGRPTCVYTETLEVTGDSVGSTKDSDAIIRMIVAGSTALGVVTELC